MQANRFLVNLSRAAFAAALTFGGAAALAHDSSGDSPRDVLFDRPADALAVTTLVRTGEGDHTYENVPNWCQIPGGRPTLGPMHGGVVEDKEGLIYFTMDGGPNAILVYKPDGTFVKGIGDEKLTGIHGMNINEENGEQFLYCAQTKAKRVLKLKLDGTIVWEIPFDKFKESGKFPDGPGKFNPTSAVCGPDGSVYVADGYGTSWLFKFDKDQKFVKSFGGPGTEPGKFKTCHGIGLDKRGEKPLLLICDRENRRLQYFDLDGNFVKIVAENLRRPCAPSFHGDHFAIAELEGRVTIFDKDNKEVAHLGDNPDHAQWATNKVDPKDFKPGIFTAPHGLSYDHEGNIYVMDWNLSGRLSKFKPIGAADAAKQAAKPATEKPTNVASR
jgi:sugar lactone lactonase YvrE